MENTGTGTIDMKKAQLSGPRMAELKATLAVTLDDQVRRLAVVAFDHLQGGSKLKGTEPVDTALDAVGARLRKINGKVP